MLDFEEIQLFYQLDESYYIQDIKPSMGLNLYPNSDPSESLVKLGRSGELTVSWNKNTFKSGKGTFEINRSQSTFSIPSMQSSYNRLSEKQSQALRYQDYLLARAEMKIAERVSPEYLKYALDTELKDKDILLTYKYCIKTTINGKTEMALGDKDYRPLKGTREYKTPYRFCAAFTAVNLHYHWHLRIYASDNPAPEEIVPDKERFYQQHDT